MANYDLCDALRPHYPASRCQIFVLFLPGQHEQEQGHTQVRRSGVHPDAERQRVQKPKQLWLFLLRFRVQYANAQRHERRGKVHRGPPIESDRQVAYGQVRVLRKRPRRVCIR